MFPTPRRRRRFGREVPTRRAAAAAFGPVRPFESFESRLLLDGSGASFSAVYYNNADLTSPAVTRDDTAINFDWGRAAPAAGVDPSTFSVRWTGFVKPTYGQTYTFYTTADDGVRLWVNGQLLIDHWSDRPRLAGDANNDGVVDFADFQMLERQFGTSGPQTDFNNDQTVNTIDFKTLLGNYGKTLAAESPTQSATIALAAGQLYTVTMEYYQSADQASAKLEWQSPSQARQVVPAAPPDPVSVGGDGSGGGGGTGGGPIVVVGDGHGLFGTYFDNSDLTGTQVTRIDPTVAFRWEPQQQPIARVQPTTFSVRWEGQVLAPVSGIYTFFVNSDDGARLWVDNQPVLDVWGDKTESEYASDPVQMVAGQRYNIRLEYYQNEGDDVVELRWGGAVPYQIIPTSQLFPTVTPMQPEPPVVDPGPLRVGDDGRSIVQTNGSAFFWLADTAWALFNATTRTDVDAYLNDRADKEFTVTQAVLYNPDAFDQNAYHQPVFLNNNPATPNPAYFDHVDYVLQEARSLGMYVEVLPTWGDAVAASDSRKVFNTTNAYAYGQWLGARYAGQANIVWSLGGDWPASSGDVQAVWRALADGLRAGDGGTHLITFHPPGDHSSTEYFGAGDTWLSFNEVQSGHVRDSSNYTLVGSAYAANPAKPVIDAEPNYENIPNGLQPGGTPLDDYDVRKKTYWSLFAGAFGAAYGDYEVYQFYDGNEPGLLPWQQALNYPGASEMKFARRLMLSRPMQGRVPDQGLIVGSTLTGTDHIQATRAGDGSYALIYSASGQDFTVDTSRLSGNTLQGYWYNPRDGSVTQLGTFAKSGSQSFTPPSRGYGNDWVLVLDDVDSGYNGPTEIPRAADISGSTTGSVSDGSMTLPYRLFAPTGVPAGQKVPLVLFLHGSGDRGTDNVMQTEWMGGLINATKGGPYAAYVLAPQIDKNSWFQSFTSTPTEAMALTIKALKYVMATQNIDLSRVYVTGNSMGGMGAWDILYREPKLFAAAVPMSGGADLKTVPVIKSIPVWAFHGSDDDIVPVSATRDTIQALRDAGGNPLYTEVAGGKHTIWEPIYDDYSHTLYPWLFSQVNPNVPVGGTTMPSPPVKATTSKPTSKPLPFSVTPVTREKRQKPAARRVIETLVASPSVGKKVSPPSKLIRPAGAKK